MPESMPAHPARLLVIEDDLIQTELIQHALKSVRGIDTQYAATGRQGLQLLRDWRPDILLVDLYLPDIRGLEILAQVRAQGLTCTVFASSATESVNEAVEALREGAAEFLGKPLDIGRFQGLLRGAIDQVLMLRNLEEASETRNRAATSEMIAEAPVMKHMLTALRAAARGKAPVLIAGEHGSGRELLARHLHSLSGRSSGKFVVFRPEDPAASQNPAVTFNHAIESADAGTLYIPELRALSHTVQKALLAFLESRRGTTAEKNSNVRIVASMDDSVTPGETSIAVDPRLLSLMRLVTIAVPPLRVRGEDILLAAEGALRREAEFHGIKFHGIDPAAQKLLMTYTWPGNLDELIQTMSSIVHTYKPQILEVAHLPSKIQITAKDQTRTLRPKNSIRPRVKNIKPLWLVEKEAIEAALAAFNGDVLEAARALQTSPATIYRKQKLWSQQGAHAIA